MGKSPTHIADAKKQRIRMVLARQGTLHINKEKNYTEITTAEVKCRNCGFTARYKFVRCPECNILNE